MDKTLRHPLNCCHPGPFFLVGLRIDVKVNFWRLYSESIRPIILIFIIGFKSLDFLQGDSLGWILVDTLLYKTIEVSFGENHPSFLPFLQVTRSLHEEPLLDFIIPDVCLDEFIAFHW